MAGELNTIDSWRDRLLLVMLFCFPSFAFVDKHGGWPAVAGYLLVAAGLLCCVRRVPAGCAVAVERRFGWWLAVLALGLIVVFAVLYPMENARGVLHSSDREDGLNMAVARLIAGEYPYYPPNSHAGPLSLLPGAILLGTPFAIAGNSAYQNIVWLLVFVAATARQFRDRTAALAMIGFLMILSPAAQYEFISGGDMLANGIYVLVFSWLAIGQYTGPAPAWRRLAVLALLGIGLTSRPNFLFILPLIAATIWRHAGFKQAAIAAAGTVLVVALLTVPFYWHDPAGFTPLPTGNKLAGLDRHLPWASRTVIVGSVLLATGLALWQLRTPAAAAWRTFCRYAAVILLFPMLAAVVLYSVVRGGPDYDFIRDRYGLMYLSFALWGWWGEWFASRTTGAPETA